MMRGKLFVCVVVLVQCAGCAWQAQAVKITPDLKSTSTLSGNGKTVELSIADERSSKTIGQRGVSGVGADMTVDGDLEKILHEALVSGLGKHNFMVGGDAKGAGSKLRVEIRNLSSKNIMGFWAGTLRDEFGVKAFCKSDSGAEYQKMYNGVFETSIQVVPTGEANNKYISSAVSDGVNQLVNDDALLSCLAGNRAAGSSPVAR